MEPTRAWQEPDEPTVLGKAWKRSVMSDPAKAAKVAQITDAEWDAWGKEQAALNKFPPGGLSSEEKVDVAAGHDLSIIESLQPRQALGAGQVFREWANGMEDDPLVRAMLDARVTGDLGDAEAKQLYQDALGKLTEDQSARLKLLESEWEGGKGDYYRNHPAAVAERLNIEKRAESIGRIYATSGIEGLERAAKFVGAADPELGNVIARHAIELQQGAVQREIFGMGVAATEGANEYAMYLGYSNAKWIPGASKNKADKKAAASVAQSLYKKLQDQGIEWKMADKPSIVKAGPFSSKERLTWGELLEDGDPRGAFAFFKSPEAGELVRRMVGEEKAGRALEMMETVGPDKLGQIMLSTGRAFSAIKEERPDLVEGDPALLAQEMVLRLEKGPNPALEWAFDIATRGAKFTGELLKAHLSDGSQIGTRGWVFQDGSIVVNPLEAFEKYDQRVQMGAKPEMDPKMEEAIKERRTQLGMDTGEFASRYGPLQAIGMGIDAFNNAIDPAVDRVSGPAMYAMPVPLIDKVDEVSWSEAWEDAKAAIWTGRGDTAFAVITGHQSVGYGETRGQWDAGFVDIFGSPDTYIGFGALTRPVRSLRAAKKVATAAEKVLLDEAVEAAAKGGAKAAEAVPPKPLSAWEEAHAAFDEAATSGTRAQKKAAKALTKQVDEAQAKVQEAIDKGAKKYPDADIEGLADNIWEDFQGLLEESIGNGVTPQQLRGKLNALALEHLKNSGVHANQVVQELEGMAKKVYEALYHHHHSWAKAGKPTLKAAAIEAERVRPREPGEVVRAIADDMDPRLAKGYESVQFPTMGRMSEEFAGAHKLLTKRLGGTPEVEQFSGWLLEEVIKDPNLIQRGLKEMMMDNFEMVAKTLAESGDGRVLKAMDEAVERYAKAGKNIDDPVVRSEAYNMGKQVGARAAMDEMLPDVQGILHGLENVVSKPKFAGIPIPGSKPLTLAEAIQRGAHQGNAGIRWGPIDIPLTPVIKRGAEAVDKIHDAIAKGFKLTPRETSLMNRLTKYPRWVASVFSATHISLQKDMESARISTGAKRWINLQWQHTHARATAGVGAHLEESAFAAMGEKWVLNTKQRKVDQKLLSHIMEAGRQADDEAILGYLTQNAKWIDGVADMSEAQLRNTIARLKPLRDAMENELDVMFEAEVKRGLQIDKVREGYVPHVIYSKGDKAPAPSAGLDKNVGKAKADRQVSSQKLRRGPRTIVEAKQMGLRVEEDIWALVYQRMMDHHLAMASNNLIETLSLQFGVPAIRGQRAMLEAMEDSAEAKWASIGRPLTTMDERAQYDAVMGQLRKATSVADAFKEVSGKLRMNPQQLMEEGALARVLENKGFRHLVHKRDPLIKAMFPNKKFRAELESFLQVRSKAVKAGDEDALKALMGSEQMADLEVRMQRAAKKAAGAEGVVRKLSGRVAELTGIDRLDVREARRRLAARSSTVGELTEKLAVGRMVDPGLAHLSPEDAMAYQRVADMAEDAGITGELLGSMLWDLHKVTRLSELPIEDALALVRPDGAMGKLESLVGKPLRSIDGRLRPPTGHAEALLRKADIHGDFDAGYKQLLELEAKAADGDPTAIARLSKITPRQRKLIDDAETQGPFRDVRDAESLGKAFGEVDAKDFHENWVTAMAGGTPLAESLKNIYLPMDMAVMIRTVLNESADQAAASARLIAVGSFGHAMDSVTRLWKSSVTDSALGPAFAKRNQIDGMKAILHIMGVEAYMPSVRREVEGLLKGTVTELRTANGHITREQFLQGIEQMQSSITGREDLIAMAQKGAADRGKEMARFQTKATQELALSMRGVDPKFKGIDSKTFWREHRKEMAAGTLGALIGGAATGDALGALIGGGSAFGVTKAVRGQRRGGPPGAGGRAMPTLRESMIPMHGAGTEVNENYYKAVIWHYNLKRGLSYNEAMELTLKQMRDYSNYKPAERAFLGFAPILFYNFAKQNTIAQITRMADRPGFMGMQAKFLHYLNDETPEDMRPEWMSPLNSAIIAGRGWLMSDELTAPFELFSDLTSGQPSRTLTPLVQEAFATFNGRPSAGKMPPALAKSLLQRYGTVRGDLAPFEVYMGKEGYAVGRVKAPGAWLMLGIGAETMMRNAGRLSEAASKDAWVQIGMQMLPSIKSYDVQSPMAQTLRPEGLMDKEFAKWGGVLESLQYDEKFQKFIAASQWGMGPQERAMAEEMAKYMNGAYGKDLVRQMIDAWNYVQEKSSKGEAAVVK